MAKDRIGNGFNRWGGCMKSGVAFLESKLAEIKFGKFGNRFAIIFWCSRHIYSIGKQPSYFEFKANRLHNHASQRRIPMDLGRIARLRP